MNCKWPRNQAGPGRSQLLKFLIFICGLLYFFPCRAAGDSLTLLASKMARINLYEESITVGYAGSLSEQYGMYGVFVNQAPRARLVEWASSHANAVVRLYAFQALRDRKEVIPSWLRKQIAADNAIVTKITGCEGVESTVSTLAGGKLPFRIPLPE